MPKDILTLSIINGSMSGFTKNVFLFWHFKMTPILNTHPRSRLSKSSSPPIK